jgi:uncharacterized protein
MPLSGSFFRILSSQPFHDFSAPLRYNHIKTTLTDMENLTFSNVRKYRTEDPDAIWAEVHGSAYVPSTGRRYEQDYVGLFKVKDGKIVYYSEYWNPVALTDAFGNT